MLPREPREKGMGAYPFGRSLLVGGSNGGHLSVPRYLRVERRLLVAAPLYADRLDDNVPVPNHHRITVRKVTNQHAGLHPMRIAYCQSDGDRGCKQRVHSDLPLPLSIAQITAAKSLVHSSTPVSRPAPQCTNA